MEQRIEKLNNSEHSGMKDPLPFPIEPLRAVPNTLHRKQVSKTSSNSGVNSRHTLPPAMPTTPENLQPFQSPLIRSPSRVDTIPFT